MEREVEHEDFDFNKNKKIENILEKRVIFSENMKKRAKYLAFLVLGGVAVGAGMGIVNTFSHSYLIDKQKNAEIEVIQVKNEELRKNELNQVEAKKQAAQNEID